MRKLKLILAILFIFDIGYTQSQKFRVSVTFADSVYMLGKFKFVTGAPNGYVLSVDGSGNVTPIAVGAGTIIGGGTNGNIPIFTDVDSIGNSKLNYSEGTDPNYGILKFEIADVPPLIHLKQTTGNKQGYIGIGPNGGIRVSQPFIIGSSTDNGTLVGETKKVSTADTIALGTGIVYGLLNSYATTSGIAIYGNSPSGIGIRGQSTSGIASYGEGSIGGYFRSNSSYALIGNYNGADYFRVGPQDTVRSIAPFYAGVTSIIDGNLNIISNNEFNKISFKETFINGDSAYLQIYPSIGGLLIGNRLQVQGGFYSDSIFSINGSGEAFLRASTLGSSVDLVNINGTAKLRRYAASDDIWTLPSTKSGTIALIEDLNNFAGNGWVYSDTNKVYNSSPATPVHIRTKAEDTTGIALLNVYGDISATTYFGDGSQLTGISGGSNTSGWKKTTKIYTIIPGNTVHIRGVAGDTTRTSLLNVYGNVDANTISVTDLNVAGTVTIGSVISDGGGLSVGGIVTATSFSGIGTNITALNATNLTSGTVNIARLPSNIARTDGGQNFTNVGNINATGLTIGDMSVDAGSLTVVGTITGTTLVGNGSGITNINASNIATGTIASARLPNTVVLTNAGQNVTFGSVTATSMSIGNLSSDGTGLTVAGTITGTTFVGEGSNVTNLNATNLTSGTVNVARLPNNIALIDGGQTFTNAIWNAGAIISSEDISTTGGNFYVSNVSAETFIRLSNTATNFDIVNQGGVNLFRNASYTQTLPSLTGVIALTNATQNFTDVGNITSESGTFTAAYLAGNGSAVTSLNGSNISSGTINLARLPISDFSALGSSGLYVASTSGGSPTYGVGAVTLTINGQLYTLLVVEQP